MISDATARALDALDVRERQAAAAFSPEYVVTAQQNGALAYTGEARFTVRDDMLVDASGNAVLGFANSEAPLAPLRVDPIDAALGYAAQARVFSDGTFGYDRAVLDPQTGERRMDRIAIGRVAIARFPSGTRPGPGVSPHIAPAGDTAFQDRALERLQDAYITFDALRAAGHAEGSFDKTAMDLLK